jgi:hypothetical protein
MKTKSPNVVDRAIREWRGAREDDPRLQAATRTRIVEAAYEARTEASGYRPLLSRIPMRILAGAVPALAATVVILLFAERTGDPSVRPVSVRATKSGDEIVFTIANGRRAHKVYKSSVPNNFDPQSGVVVRDGAFRDAMDDGSGLVFYRID